MQNPPFGQADLTNCERELIHLAGSIQPHGVLLVLRGPGLEVVQTSANTAELLGWPVQRLLNRPIAVLEGDIEARVRELDEAPDFSDPLPLRCHTQRQGQRREFEGVAHRHPTGEWIIELEPLDPQPGGADTVGWRRDALLQSVSAAVHRFSQASNIATLADAVVQSMRDLTGYDRVMVYKFDPDGHGKIIAEARDPRLESLLNHRYPASDIPQRARELYIRNRVRVLVDVHYTPSSLVPALLQPNDTPLDMSMSMLRSMSPLHLQYLKNMGVTATLVVSLVREGRLWGLIAAHHNAPRNLRFGVRVASALLAEVISTRIAAIENYAHAQVAILVRRLEQRLIEATSSEGDWRLALFRNPHILLQPLEATGAALFHDNEVLSAGDVPSTPELRALLQWVDEQQMETPFHCSSVARENPALASLTPLASGVLAVKLSATRPDYLMWFRKEQLTSVTWAGDPTKPVIGNDPLELSPRRSFAAWSEIVRGTALPWSTTELALARAIGGALVDIIVQVHAVRFLIAEHQLAQARDTVQVSDEPVIVADAQGRLLFSNSAFTRLIGPTRATLNDLHDVAELFAPAEPMRKTLAGLKTARQSWRGELALARDGGEALPVSVRADVVTARDGSVLGFILIVMDRSDHQRTAAARTQFETSLSSAAMADAGAAAFGGGASRRESDAVLNAILTNASLAAMDIADGDAGPSAAPLLQELEASTQRAAALHRQITRLRSEP